MIKRNLLWLFLSVFFCYQSTGHCLGIATIPIVATKIISTTVFGLLGGMLGVVAGTGAGYKLTKPKDREKLTANESKRMWRYQAFLGVVGVGVGAAFGYGGASMLCKPIE